MKQESIFILGGSVVQGHLIKTVKANNYKTYVLDANPNCKLANSGDVFLNIDFSNVDLVYKAALEYKPKLILTVTEIGNLTAAIVSEKLGLNYNNPTVVKSTLSKILMKNVLDTNNIKTPKVYEIFSSNASELKEKINKISNFSRFIIKPSFSSSGRGVKLVKEYNRDLIESYIEQAISFSNDKLAIVEEYIQGKQFSIETLSCSGEHFILGITREFFLNKESGVEAGHIFPAYITDDIKNKINEVIYKVLDAFKIKVGASHIELRLTESGEIYLIEIASRLGGYRCDMMDLLKINFSKLLLSSHTEDDLKFKSNFKSMINGAKKSFSASKMIFSELDLQNYKQDLNDLKFSEIYWTKQKFEVKFDNAADMNGYFAMSSDSYETLKNIILNRQTKIKN